MAIAMQDQTAAQRTTLIDSAKAGVLIWYDLRVDLKQARYFRKTGQVNRTLATEVPEEIVRSPDLLAVARRARPENWRRRSAYGLQVPLTASGTETPPPGHSTEPRHGVGSVLQVVSYARHAGRSAMLHARMSVLRLMQPTMIALEIIDIEAHKSLEMWAAGFKLAQITKRLNCSRNTAIKAQSCGLTWVAGCLLVRPEFTDGEPPRKMLPEEL